MNAARLDAELRAAGLAISGCSGDGRVDFQDGSCWRPGDPTPDDRTRAAAAVVAAHNPAPTRAQRLAACGCTEVQAALVLVAVRGPLAPAWAREILAAAADRIDGALR